MFEILGHLPHLHYHEEIYLDLFALGTLVGHFVLSPREKDTFLI